MCDGARARAHVPGVLNGSVHDELAQLLPQILVQKALRPSWPGPSC